MGAGPAPDEPSEGYSVRVERRLERWVKAGLITHEQAQSILEHESKERRPLFMYGVAGLGGLAVAIGLISIVAANWDAIPGRVKIGIDLAMLVGLSVGLLRLESRGPRWLSESALIVMYGLVLASIALVSQVYQLGGEVHEALVVWSVLTMVLMSRAHSTFGAVTWVAGLQITYAAVIAQLADTDDLAFFFVSTLYWVPLLSIAASQSSALADRRPRLARVLGVVGWVEVLMCATVGTFVFYGDTASEDWLPMLLGAAVSAGLTLVVIRGLPEGEARRPRAALLGACWVLAHIGWPLSRGDLDLVAALTFIGLWLGVAFTAHRARAAAVLNAATALVGVRIIAVYFEVFGSLLDTGLGLVLGGVLTLGVVWLWARKRRDFETELAQGGRS